MCDQQGKIEWNPVEEEYFRSEFLYIILQFVYRHEFGPEVSLDSTRKVTYCIQNECMIVVKIPIKDITQTRRAVLKYQGGSSKFLGSIIPYVLFSL